MNWNNRLSVWKQREYNGPLAGQQANQGHERQSSEAGRSIWMTLYITVYYCITKAPDTAIHVFQVFFGLEGRGLSFSGHFSYSCSSHSWQRCGLGWSYPLCCLGSDWVRKLFCWRMSSPVVAAASFKGWVMTIWLASCDFQAPVLLPKHGVMLQWLLQL